MWGFPIGIHRQRRKTILHFILIVLLVVSSFLWSNETVSDHHSLSGKIEAQYWLPGLQELEEVVKSNNTSKGNRSRYTDNVIATPDKESAIVPSAGTSDENEQTGNKIDDLKGQLKDIDGRLKQRPPWKDSSTWTRVTQGAYNTTIETARRATFSVLNDVYADCKLFLVPSAENETNAGIPKIKFQCRQKIALQDDPCHSVNVCLVVLNETMWNERITLAAQSKYNHGKNQDLAPSRADRRDKSSLLMMVDSIDYLQEEDNFYALMNKASYAYFSNRSLFVWIGDLNQTELNRREDEVVSQAFGATCVTKKVTNTMHYYKPIAILAVFAKQSIVQNIQSLIFLDADTDFTEYAFENMHDLGPENYLDLSPQASLMGTQNTKGQIIMNSGILILQNTTWSHDFAALWWLTRCGSKDQRGLWLVMFATFSVRTAPLTDRPKYAVSGIMNGTVVTANTTIQQFAYPAEMFFNYDYAFAKGLMHFRRQIFQIQSSWEALANGHIQDSFPRPTNVSLYNGGDLVHKRKVTVPLELPHVMLLPLTSFLHHKDNGSVLELPGLKADILSKGGKSFVVHSKDNIRSCSNGRCWPYNDGQNAR